jgi:hypothetical protein
LHAVVPADSFYPGQIVTSDECFLLSVPVFDLPVRIVDIDNCNCLIQIEIVLCVCRRLCIRSNVRMANLIITKAR